MDYEREGRERARGGSTDKVNCNVPITPSAATADSSLPPGQAFSLGYV